MTGLYIEREGRRRNVMARLLSFIFIGKQLCSDLYEEVEGAGQGRG